MRFATTISGVGEPTFVLLHGLASTRHIFDLVVPLLAKDHKVIAFDLRGHGETEKPDDGYALADFSDDVDELLRRYGVSRPFLIGHSFGANVALHHATTRRSARGLVLVDGGLVELHGRYSWPDAADALVPPDEDAYAIEKWVREGDPRIPNSPQLQEVRRSIFEWSPHGVVKRRLTADRHRKILRSLWEQDVHQALACVPCRTLVVACRAATDDPVERRRLVQKEVAARHVARLPRVSVRWFDDTVHDIPLQRPRELAQAILEFAATIPAVAA